MKARVNFRTTVLVAGVVGAAAMLAGEASAAEAAASTTSVGEIVVTAEKRSELLSKVPVAVSAFSGDELSDRGYANMADFTGAVPNVNVIMNNGTMRVESRGIFQQSGLPGGDSAVAFYVNGVLLPHIQDVGVSFYDVDRIEALKGPQGTLYGYNSIGGTVNVITKLPTDEFEASEELTYGNYQTINTRSVLSGPILPHLWVRLAVATDNHDGYSLNLFDNKRYDDQKANGERLTIVATPTDNITSTTIADHHHENDGNYATHFGGVAIPGTVLQGVMLGGMALPVDQNGFTIDPRLLDDYVAFSNKRESWGISEELSWRLSQELSLKSISSYRRLQYLYGSDFMATTFPFPSDVPGYNLAQIGQFHYFSQELQLIGAMPRLNWILGGFYLDDVGGGFTHFGLAPAPAVLSSDSGGSFTKNAYAAFGQATYHPTGKLGLTVGLRESYETVAVNTKQETNGVVRVGRPQCLPLPGHICNLISSTSFSSLTPKVAVDYQWTNYLMTYASFTGGYQAGGYNLQQVTPAYKPATVRSYEIGLKAHAPDYLWSANLAVFHLDYTNIQVNEVVSGISETINAGAAKVDGGELELAFRPIQSVTITDALAIEDPRYTNFTEINVNFPFQGPNGFVNNAGHILQNAHRFTNNSRIEWTVPVGEDTIRIAGEWSYRGKVYFSEYNDNLESQPANSTFNASIRFISHTNKWWVELFGRNLTDQLIVAQTSIGGCGCLNSQYEPPRLVGVRVGFRN